MTEQEKQDRIKYLQEQIVVWKEHIWLQEQSNDFYFTRGTQRQDAAQLRAYEQELKQLTEQ